MMIYGAAPRNRKVDKRCLLRCSLGVTCWRFKTSDDVTTNLHFAFADEAQKPTESFYPPKENNCACLDILVLLSFFRRNRLCASKLRALDRSSYLRRQLADSKSTG